MPSLACSICIFLVTKNVPAWTVINGCAVCEAHVSYVEHGGPHMDALIAARRDEAQNRDSAT